MIGLNTHLHPDTFLRGFSKEKINLLILHHQCSDSSVDGLERVNSSVVCHIRL